MFTYLTTIYEYDSLCRPVHYLTSEENPAGIFLTSGKYYYGDCDHIVVAGADTIIACLNNQAGVAESNAGQSVQIFPNPANDLLNVRIEYAQQTEWTIADLQGRILMSGPFDGNEFQVPVDQLSVGMYLLHLNRHLIKLLIRD